MEIDKAYLPVTLSKVVPTCEANGEVWIIMGGILSVPVVVNSIGEKDAAPPDILAFSNSERFTVVIIYSFLIQLLLGLVL
jgi:hypothetical protein